MFEKLESGDFPEAVEELVVKNKVNVNDCFKVHLLLQLLICIAPVQLMIFFQESYTPLMVAAQNGCVNSARKLIELGADVNAATSVRQIYSK